MDLSDSARRLVDSIEYATVATVSTEGQPWNSPVFFARQGRSFYWLSRRDAQHSLNVAANSRAFLVIYDSRREDSSGAALYIDAVASEVRDREAIDSALGIIYRRKEHPAPPGWQFEGSSPHRVYRAVARAAWTNLLHSADVPPWDERVAIDILDEPI